MYQGYQHFVQMYISLWRDDNKYLDFFFEMFLKNLKMNENHHSPE